MEMVFKALADEKRRQILDLLKDGPLTTNEIAAYFDISRIGVMKHLDVLEKGKLILIRRKGRERFNHLNAIPIQMIYKRWMEPFSSFWAEGLLELKKQLETEDEEKSSVKHLPKLGDLRFAADSSVKQKENVMEKIHLEMEVEIAASPARVFEAMTRDISQWWGIPYNISEDIEDIVLDAKLGGHLYETWKGGGSASWGVVTKIKEANLLQITGPIGMSTPVAGVVDFNLVEKANGTVVKLSHQVIGDVNEKTKENYGNGWNDLLAVRLKAFVEDGTKYGIGYDLPPKVPSFE
jgi:DNA-binding transcriptional ArsR family regulator/uncharacterized protein YndB with AHSA1/START domain